ncbi:hypothetical protein MMYC01_207768 [Madurella mycetomatis]|uniref:Apple domain-containing protein n=1 Tax=Madurella mycetomatis TaxID=100816 RepID=A0A175VU65_9PEZI|nr:hypothetical protein MMYC01_207768 [Madurella mycetomatis]
MTAHLAFSGFSRTLCPTSVLLTPTCAYATGGTTSSNGARMDPYQTVQQQEQYYQLQDVPGEKVAPFQYQQQAFQPYRTDASGSDATTSTNTILNVKRSVALGVLAVIVLLSLAVIGLSAGLGVSQRDLRQVKGDLEVAQAIFSSAVAAGAATTVFHTPTPASASSTASATTVADVQCPRANGTMYTARTGSKQFRRMCGIDYGGEGEAVDIGNVQTRSLDACIDACAARPSCTGAGWGVIDGDSGAMHSCWMKTNLTRFHRARDDWGFAVLVSEE